MSTGTTNTNFSGTQSIKVAQMFTGDQNLSDEGSFFVATNTPGTAIATTTSVVDDATGATTHAQQKPVMAITNQAATTNVNSPNIYLRYLKMFIVQVPTSAALWRYAMRLDPLTSKITTAGTVITPVNPNSAATRNASAAYITFGAITTTDSTSSPSQRLVANGQVTGAIPVANDEWLFAFGQPAAGFDLVGTQTLVKRITVPVPPIVIAPGWTWTLEMWAASNAAAPSWEFELGYVERPSGQ